MKKLILSYSTIILFLFYVAFVRNPDQAPILSNNAGINNPIVAAASTTPSATKNPIPTTPIAQAETPVPVAVPKPTSAAAPKPKATVPVPTPVAIAKKGQYTDGTYTGSVADAYYGNVQVQAVINQGKLVDVVFLDYPHDRNTSREINSQATPMLRQEAIQAQSAKVDGVSGATATSGAFRESLGAALSKARA